MMKPVDRVRRSIYAQLLFVVAASLLLALLFVGVALERQKLHYEERGLLEELRFSGELLANRTVAALLFNDPAAVATNIASGRFIPSVMRVCAYNDALESVADFVRDGVEGDCAGSLAAAEVAQEVAIDRDRAWAVVPVEDDDRVLGYLQIVATTDLIRQRVQNALLVVVLILGGALVVAFALGARMLRRALHPLSVRNRDVRVIADKPFTDHRARKFHNDEVGDLVDGFNRMLDALAEENAALHQSEKRFRTLADNSPVGIYLKDANAQLQYANGKWSEITGLSAARADTDLSGLIAEMDWPRYRRMVHNVIEGQQPDHVEYSYRPPGAEQSRMLLEYLAPVIQRRAGGGEPETVAVIGSVLDVTELKQAQMELERLAFYDPLTGLPNRRFFRDHLQYQMAAAGKHRQTLSVLMIDLDDFKRINDSMGHDAGDHLLSILGQRLQECCFEEDVVSRLGGDEFIVLLNTASKITIETVVERIQQAINTPVEFHNRIIETRCSIGVACFPVDAASARDLIKHADIALYEAKAMGRNRMVYFSSELNRVLQEHIALEIKLQDALRNDRLSLYLQPQVDARSGRPVWSEALLRWHDEELGFVPPDKFIPIAEESGLIWEVGQWVTRETCRLWRDYGTRLAAIGIGGISINLSPRQFYAGDLVEATLAVLREYDVSPANIAFEITESLVMEDIELAMLTMRRLRSEGFQLAMDDFGTGYSSLSYLKQFTIDHLKIDKSFVDGLPDDQNDSAITGAIIAMARQLGIGVVAEGIETEQQMQVLLANGCERMQGYLFARPVPVEELLQRGEGRES